MNRFPSRNEVVDGLEFFLGVLLISCTLVSRILRIGNPGCIGFFVIF